MGLQSQDRPLAARRKKEGRKEGWVRQKKVRSTLLACFMRKGREGKSRRKKRLLLLLLWLLLLLLLLLLSCLST
jgi:hypothetical protein